MAEQPVFVGAARVDRVRAALAGRLASVVVVAECVRRRHNASAILRSAEAFGLHEVHLITRGFRVSKGAARGAERWILRRRFDTTEESLSELRGRGFRIVVADVRPGALPPEDVPVDAPLALVLGSEALGPSETARSFADFSLMIPMRGLTESLNVSVSGAIAMRVLAERRRARVGADLPPVEQARFLEAWLAAEEDAIRGFHARTSATPRPLPPAGRAGGTP
jgi:tRNA (guanosine-2'-O-)-methyltransferase